jgi:predicted Zn finger-like uncharacterized protein
MPIQISCPSCSRPLRVPDHLLGQLVKCPNCQQQFTAASAQAIRPAERPKPESEPAPYRSQPVSELGRPMPPRPDDFEDDDDYDDRPRRRRRHYEPHRGTLILVLGIVSIIIMVNLGLGFVTGIPAWVMGNADMKKIKAGVMDPAGAGQTNAGRIMGVVVTILNLVVCGCGVVWVLVMIAAGK